MIGGSLARRYAKALFALATEEGGVEEASVALGALAAAVQDVDAERLAPGVLEPRAWRRLGEALAQPFGAHSTRGRFVRLLAERQRLALLPAIRDWFVRMQDEAAGRARVTIASAAPLEDSQVREVSAAFESLAGRAVVPETRVDAELIGGVVVELQGRVYDGSVKTHLARLAARMAGL